MNMIEIKKDENEFSENKIEKEYKSIDLNILERKGSYNILTSNQFKNFKEEFKEEEIEPLSHSFFQILFLDFHNLFHYFY